jgi:hypothetical protein
MSEGADASGISRSDTIVELCGNTATSKAAAAGILTNTRVACCSHQVEMTVMEKTPAQKPSQTACRFCKHPHPVGAIYCTNCENWLNWRRFVNFSLPVLSVILAILTVGLTSGRDVYNAIMFDPSIDVVLDNIELDKNPEVGERPQAMIGKINVLVANSEDRFVTASKLLECKLSNVKVPTEVLTARYLIFSEVNGRYQPSDFVSVAAKSQTSLEFGGVYSEGADFDKMLQADTQGYVAVIKTSCNFKYYFAGKPYERTITNEEPLHILGVN